MKKVTDPELLRQLEGGSPAPLRLKPVEDPAILKALESPDAASSVDFNASEDQKVRQQETSPGRVPGQSPIMAGLGGYLPQDGLFDQPEDVGGLGAIGGYLAERAAPFMIDPIQGVDDSVRSMAHGMSVGWMQEGVAGINALLGLGEGDTPEERYNNNLAEEERRLSEARARDPKGALASEIAGGAATSLPGAGWVMNTPKLAAVPGFVKAAGVGGASGAVAAAGEAPQGRKLEAGMYGGTLGTIWGLGLSLTKTGVSAAIQRFMQGKEGRSHQIAAQKILQALQRDELTPEEAFRRVSELGPEARLIDVGDNTRGLARAVAGQPGRAKKTATVFLNTRQEGQGSRVMGAVNRALDPKGDFAGTMDELQRLRSTAASPLYDAAYSRPIKPNNALVSLFRRPALEGAWQRASEIAKNEGAVIADNLFITRPDGGKVVNLDALKDVRTLDYIKRGLDDLIQPHIDQTTGKILTNSGRSLNGLRKEFIAVLDNLSPEYKAARAASSGPIRAMEMADRGRRFVRGDEDVLARQIAKMTEDEKLFFRMGAARALRDIIYNTPDGADAVKRVFGSELKRQRLRQLFPDNESFNEFRRIMQQESELFTTRAIASPRSGSQTQLRQEDAADLARNVGEGVAELAKGNTGNAAKRFLRGLFGKSADNIPPEQTEAIAKMLFTNDPEINRQIVRALSLERTLANLNTVSGMGAGMGAVEGGRQVGSGLAPLDENGGPIIHVRPQE